MDVIVGPTDPVFQVPGGSAVAEWTAVVVLVQVTVDPTVVLMDGGLKQNPDEVPQDELWVIDTELPPALAGSGWLKAGAASINPKNASGTSLLMTLTPDGGVKEPDGPSANPGVGYDFRSSILSPVSPVCRTR